jgi:hypothetical protein
MASTIADVPFAVLMKHMLFWSRQLYRLLLTDNKYLNSFESGIVVLAMNTKQDARKLDLYGKEDLRSRVIQAVTIENVSVTQAARLFGVSRTRLCP